MTNSNNEAAWRLQFMNSEENGDVLVEDDNDGQEEDKTVKMDLKPWTADQHLNILSVVDCLLFKSNSSNEDTINWKEVSNLMRYSKQQGQTDEWFNPKECENQYFHILRLYEEEKRKKGPQNIEDAPLVRAPNLRVELFQKLMQDRNLTATKNLAELQKEIAELSETIVSLEADEFDDRLSDISEANGSDSESEGHTENNDEYVYAMEGLEDANCEIKFWGSLAAGDSRWGPDFDTLFSGLSRTEAGNEVVINDPKLNEIIGPQRLVPGHTKKLEWDEKASNSNTSEGHVFFEGPASPKLSNLVDNAIAGEPNFVPTSQPMTPVNNAPTLSKLLEMPVRDRGQPLPTIQSLMEVDATATVDNGTAYNYREDSGSPSSLLRDLNSPMKSLLMGSPTTSDSPKVTPRTSQVTNTLPALTLLMSSSPTKNLSLPDDMEIVDPLQHIDFAAITSAIQNALSHAMSLPLPGSKQDPNESVVSIPDSQATDQSSDNSSAEKAVDNGAIQSAPVEITLSSSSSSDDKSDKSETSHGDTSSDEGSQVDLNASIESIELVDLVSSAESSIDERESLADDSTSCAVQDDVNKPSTADTKTNSVLDDPNNEIVIKLTTHVRVASQNSQSDDSNSTDNSKRKSPVKAGSRVKDRTESEEIGDEEASNHGMDSSTSTRVTRRSAKATLTKPSEEKSITTDDSHSSSIKEQEENGEKAQPRVVRTGGKKMSESIVPDAESKEEDTGKRITRARNRASIAPRERTKSSSSAKGSTANEPTAATSADGDSIVAPATNMEFDTNQDKDANDNEPTVPEKPEMNNTSLSSDVSEPEMIVKPTESLPDTEPEQTPPKCSENSPKLEVSQAPTSSDGKLPVEADEESSDKEANKRKSPKPALRTKERIESGEMADDDNSNSAFDSSSKPRMTRRSGKLSPVKEIKPAVHQEDNKIADTLETPRLKGRSARKRIANDEFRQAEVDSEVSEEVESEKRVTRARNRLSVTPRNRTKSSGSTKGLGTDQDASSETERLGPLRSLRSRGGPSTSSVIDNFPPLPSSADSNPSSPSSSTTNSVIMEDEKELLKIKTALQAFYKRIIVPKSAQIFLKKSVTDPTTKYLKAVKKPTDLNLIKQKIEAGEIRSWSQMKREVLLMVINFCMFFPNGHPNHSAAEDYYNDISHQFDIDFYNFASMFATSEDESTKDSSTRNDGETGSESELRTPEIKPKGKPGRKRRTPSTSVDEVVETKRRTLRTSTTAVTTSSWQGASSRKKNQQSPDIVSSYSRGD